MSRELIAFLHARLDEDKAAARANVGAEPGTQNGLGDTKEHGPMWPDYQTYDSPALDAASDYLNHFRPLRMLREVAAKRSIVTRYEYACRQADVNTGAEHEAWEKVAGALERDVIDLAAVYRGHPGYRQGWAPTGSSASS